MINVFDQAQIATDISNVLRVRGSHHRVDISSADLEALRNFTTDLLSKYVDNAMIQNTQFDPSKGEVVDVLS